MINKILFSISIIVAITYTSYAQAFQVMSNQADVSIEGLSLSGIAFGDIDDDGDLDMIFSGYGMDVNGSGGITFDTKLYINDGGSFSIDESSNFDGFIYSGIDFGDYDLDGDLDICISGGSNPQDFMEGSTAIYENRLDQQQGFVRTFLIQTEGFENTTIEWNDFNGDTYPDIIVTGRGNNYYQTFAMYENQTATGAGFSEIEHFESMGLSTWADIDNDGAIEFGIVTDILAQSISFFEYNNTSLISMGINNISPTITGDLKWLDYDNDSDLDLLIVTTDIFRLYENRISSNQGLILVEESAMSLTAVNTIEISDFDNDGYDDFLLLASDASLADGNELIRLYHNTVAQGGLFEEMTNQEFAVHYYGTAAFADINNDGFDDIIDIGMDEETHITNFGKIYINQNGESFAEGGGQSFSNLTRYNVSIADFDSDEDMDLIVSGDDGRTNYFSFSQNNFNEGSFYTSNTLSELTSLDNAFISAGDIDNNNTIDLFASGRYVYSQNILEINNLIAINNSDMSSNLTEISIEGLNPLFNGKSEMADMDNDGDLDIVISGDNRFDITETDYTRELQWLENKINEGGTYTRNFIAELPGNFAIIDFDNDGDMDIFSPDGAIFYENTDNSENRFTPRTNIITGITDNATITIGDYDSDGNMDIAMIGASGNSYIDIYENTYNEDQSFQLRDYSMQGVTTGDIRFIDYDNDGDLDIIAYGRNALQSYVFYLYENRIAQSNQFVSNTSFDFPEMSTSEFNIFDYDNDSDLDILCVELSEASTASYLLQNLTDNTNTLPFRCNNLNSELSANKVILSWNASSDNETNSNGLTYNIRLGTTPGATDIVSPMAFSNGIRKVTDYGNCMSGTSAYLKGLEYGTYYWSVQAIDNSLQGGSFALERSFEVALANDFEFSTNIFCVGDTVELTFSGYVADPNRAVFNWDFGNANVTEIIPNEKYKLVWNNAGTQSVSLSLSDNGQQTVPFARTIIVNEKPQLSISQFTDPVCYNTDINITSQITGGLAPYQYFWSDNSTASNRELHILDDQDISLTIIDMIGCLAYASSSISVSRVHQGQQICLVTVDRTSGKNLVVWEKTEDVNTTGYNIYRESTTSNQYDSIGHVSSDQLSVFEDLTSQPASRQYLYKITSVDNCGNESSLDSCLSHRPLFLQYNENQEGVNIDWEDYEIDGEKRVFSSYTIFRGVTRTILGDHASVTGSVNVYNDISPETLVERFFYRIGGRLSDNEICTPILNNILKTESGPFSQALSNITEMEITDIQSSDLLFSIYPMPAKDLVYIDYSGNSHIEDIEIIGEDGKILKTPYALSDKVLEVDVSSLENGSYLIKLIFPEQFLSSKIIIQK